MPENNRKSNLREDMLKDREITAGVDGHSSGVATSGSLYVVATPIGNLSDLSQRAIQTLQTVKWIAAEDKRVSRVLLDRIACSAQMLAVHAHNERGAAEHLLAKLQAGDDVALITDAGTPAISDPGAWVVATARGAGIRIVPIPGPSAPMALLSVAGLPPGPFHFEGFLPPRASARDQRLNRLRLASAALGAHLVIFEAPHRIARTLLALQAVFGAAQALVIGRELTKKFEEVHHCTAGEAVAWLAERDERRRGEFVIAIAAPATAVPADAQAGAKAGTESGASSITGGAAGLQSAMPAIDLMRKLLDELPLSRAVRLAQQITGQPHRELYALALSLKQAGAQ